ncbi:serine hydrolase [Streptomyces sp. BG9H]|uniref:Serine hydrolase n=1 Tax=Streptomyces anatolicus TaxID=2675858 RepID=A0ABS6YNF3_9ACTN|nr:serine hydrolase domain-containing protein [Streptomyces anatolicus]MBW5422961.1 serine hydrolase [Streptomyces anatolicus]
MRPPAEPASEPASLTERLHLVARAAGRDAGVAVAAYTGGDSLAVCQGFTDRTRTRPIDEATRFETGSVTKTFTALLLADMAARGVVHLGEPLSRCVPAWALPRGPHGAAITLEHLATHTAGLPRLPPGLLPTAARSWFSNPYAHYTPDRLLDSLARSRVCRRPGTRVAYSNFGMGLLGHLLAERAAADYASALQTHVLRPLHLTDTGCDGLAQATGHLRGRPRPPWSIPALPGAAALRSSARDLLTCLRYLAEPARLPDGSLRYAMTEVLRLRALSADGPRLPLAWSMRALPGRDLYFHTGATRGFTAFAGFSPRPGTAVVALANTNPTLRGTFIQQAYLLLRALSAPD